MCGLPIAEAVAEADLDAALEQPAAQQAHRGIGPHGPDAAALAVRVHDRDLHARRHVPAARQPSQLHDRDAL